jgi:hypothetical protein
MNGYKKYGLLIAGLLLLTVACKKADYLTDGGLHNPKTPLSVYDYLKEHPYKLFDTLILIVDHYKLQEELNHTGTFFASTNYSITLYMNVRLEQKKRTDENAKYTMDSLYKDLTADSVRQYMFSNKLPMSGFTDEQPHVFDNMVGTRFAVKKEKTTDRYYNEWSSVPVYFLYLIKIVGALDVPGTTPPANEEDIRVLCQTTGIETESGNGPLLHVLNNKHIFVRF